MALLPNQGPPLPVTHQPLDLGMMLRLKESLERATAGKPVTIESVAAVAKEHDVPLAHAYAALALNPNLSVDVSEQTLIAICVGGCQAQGAIDVLQRLLDARAERTAAGKPTFDVIPRTCLDMCAHSPVCLSRSQHGQAAHPRIQPDGVDEILTVLFDD